MKKKILAFVLTLVVVLSGLQMPHVHAESSAVDALQAALNKGGVVYLAEGTTEIPAGATLTVPAGATLVIPYASGMNVDPAAESDVLEAAINPYAVKGSVTKENYSELALGANAKLVVDGTVFVTAVTGTSGTSQNVVTGGYGEISTAAGSQILVNGTLENYGYVTGDGTLTATSGAKVSDLFTIINFRGATHLASVVGGMEDESNTFPLNESGTGNIQVRAYYKDGSNLFGNALIFAGGKENRDEFLIIGDRVLQSGSVQPALYVQENGACIVKETTNPSTSDAVLNEEVFLFDGDVSMKSSKLKVKISHEGIDLNMNLSTGYFMFPIAGNTTIEVVSGTTTVENGFKFMPGSKMLVHNGATLDVVAKDLYPSLGVFNCMYKSSANEECTGYLVFYDYETFAAVDSNISPAYTSGTEDAVLVVNGTLVLSDEATVAGNVIICENGKVETDMYIEGEPSSVTLKEAGQLSTDYLNSIGAKLTPVTFTTDWNTVKQDHAWGEGKPVGTVVCGQDNTMVHTCKNCGTSEEYVAFVEHTYETVVTEPTCTEEGYTAKTCSLCGDETVSDTVPALGHSFTKYTSNNDATCGVDGTKKAYCDRECGATDTITDVGSALAHDYDSVVTEATCEAGGHTKHTCKVCGDVKYDALTPSLGHDLSDWTVVTEATCTEAGKEERGCTRCDYSEEREIKALGHDLSDWTVVTEATCTEAGEKHSTCTRCDYFEEKEIEALGHDFGDWTVVTEATCTEAGKKHSTCARCDYFEEKEIEALGHDYKDVVTEPTCTEGGYTTHTCERCDIVTVDTKVEALGHDYKDVVTAPTCTEGGYTTHTCERCSDSFVDTKVDALGHDYKDVVTEPTCTEGGYTTHTCERCSDSYVDTKVDALGHDYKDVVTEPTCTEGGYTTHTCERCSDNYVDTKVDALGHSYGDYTSNNDATCTEDGTKTAKCVRCDVTDTVADKDSALGHDYKDVVTEPTCTEGGYTTHTCERCSDSYVDTKVDALGHSYGDYTSNNDATCTEDGTKAAKCVRCDVTDTVADKDSALGHDYKDVVTEPTCTEGGYTTHTCERCSDSYVDTKVDALGHSYGDYTSNNDATCTEDGTKTAKCVRCDVTDTVADEGSAKGHGATKVVNDKAPTCTTEGYTGDKACADCGEVLGKGEVISATGHNYVGVACDKCGDKLVVASKVENVDISKPVDKVTIIVPQESADKVTEAVTGIVDSILKGEITDEVKAAVSEDVMEAVKNEIAAGNKITTEIIATIIADGVAETLVADDVAAIEAALAEKEIVAQYMDIQVVVKSVSPAGGEKELGTLNELGKEISFVVAMPASMKVTGREFFVFRAHEGKVDKLATTKNADGTISFKTDRFSTYALAYKDKATVPVAPVTADSNMVVGYALASVVALAAILFTMKKKSFAR